MKINSARFRVLLLLLFVVLPFLWNQSSTVASAATPTMKDKTIEIVGKEQEYQLEINNMVANSKYRWSSTKPSVAKVSSKGLVTSVGKGTTTIKCQITYSNGKMKNLSTKVTVLVPATDVSINNTDLVNDAHIIKVGESYDFNRTITPKDSSDKTYWSVGHAYKEEDKGSISVDSAGVVTGLKPGKVTLYASAAKNKELSKKREIYDSVIIEVVAPSLNVDSAEIINSKELKVVFDSAVQQNTVIDNGKLSPNIAITLGTDTKKNVAKDPGDLSASLSKDGTVLTITPTLTFEGNYYINFSNKVTSMTGVQLDEIGLAINYIDEIGPEVSAMGLDDTGFVNTITFTEPINITKMKIVSALAVGSGTTDASTTAMLKNTLNYVLSSDKKSLNLNLSNIAKADQGKMFAITVQGITDLNGNEPVDYFSSFYVTTDASSKPQAKPLMIQRTGYKTVTVTFDRSIKNPGFGYLANGGTINGVLDSDDNKKVNYTLSDADAIRTGTQVFSVGYWSGYNVTPTDLTAEGFRQLSCDFTVEKTKPYLTSFVFDPSTRILTITYSEPVSTIQNTGYISYKVNTINNEIDYGTLAYTKMLTGNTSEVKLSLSNLNSNGVYTFTLNSGFVEDSFKNYSDSAVITINNTTSTTSSELPAPYLVAQSSVNLNQIIVNFAHRVDITSAQQLSNYNIPGVQLLSAELVRNTTSGGAEIVLTVANESITATAERPMIISGIKGLNDSYGEMTTYRTTILLKDNVKPAMIDGSAKLDSNQPNVIRITFNEEITGIPIFRVIQQGTTPITIGSSAHVSGNTVIITLTSIPTRMSYLRIDMIGGSISDLSGNTITTIPTTGVVVQY